LTTRDRHHADDPARLDPDANASRFAANPFHVLGLSPRCTRAEVEREGQKLLHMLHLGLASARTYATPLGPRTRDENTLRSAMAALRDPQTRLHHELWAALPPVTNSSAPVDPPPPTDPVAKRLRPWPAALALFGWRRRR
jgi:hypothetical protein